MAQVCVQNGGQTRFDRAPVNLPESGPEGQVLFSRLAKQGRLRQLQLLLALAQCGSIVRAAAHLHMSQSAATQALAELERVLDMRLFERHARGMRPTLAGQALTDAARGVMTELEEAAHTLAAIRMGASAALRLGTIPAAAQAILAQLLTRFYGLHPLVHIDVQEGSALRLLPQLISGGLDALFCRAPGLLPDAFEFEPLLDDEAVVVASHAHPLVGRPQLQLSDLDSARWVLPSANIAVRDIFERDILSRLPQAQWFPVATMSLSVLEGLLGQPQAVSLMPRSIVEHLGPDGRGARFAVLDLQPGSFQSALPPLGVVFAREAAPQLLGEMLRLWRRPGLL